MARVRIVRFFTEDLGAKALSVLLAFVLWISVSFLGTRTVIVAGVSVGVVGLREDVALAESPAPVDVKIRAPRSLLRQREAKEFLRAFVELSGRGIGAQATDVTVSATDPRVDVLVVLPSRVNLTLDPIVQRSLPVAVVPEGTPADGYEVGDATVEPTVVPVRGALRRLQDTPQIPVKVSVQGASRSIAGEFPISAPDGITALTERVTVRLEVRQGEMVKTVGIRVVTAGVPAAGYWVRSVSAEPAAVAIRGPRSAVQEQLFVETVPVEVAGVRDRLERSVALHPPEKVSVEGSSTEVRVVVDVVPFEGSKEVTAAVQVSEVPEGLRVTTVSPGSVRVTVRGSGEAFDRLRDDDVRVVLSASGRSAGTFALRPESSHVRVPGGVPVVSVEGVEVSVTLEGS